MQGPSDKEIPTGKGPVSGSTGKQLHGPLLYTGMPKWQAVAAFGAALAVHALAVGIAALNPEPPVIPLDDIPEAFVEMSLEQEQAPPEPTPPEEEEPEPLEAPPEPIEPPEFQEEQATPPPKPREKRDKPIAPIAKPRAEGKPTGPAPSGRAAMISKGNVQYPYEAKRARMTGSGVAVVSVSASGSVTSVSMAKSTGHAALDNAAVSGLRGARFKPGTVPQVKIPITFTLTGAQF